MVCSLMSLTKSGTVVVDHVDEVDDTVEQESLAVVLSLYIDAQTALALIAPN